MNYTKKIWGITFFISSLDDYLIYLREIIKTNKKVILTGINPYSLSIIKHNSKMLDALRISTLANIDGILLKIALQISGYKIKKRLDTPTVFGKLMEICVEQKLKIFLLGSKKDDLPLICKELNNKYSKIDIVGCYHGFFKEKDENLVVNEINGCNPDVLILGMPSPKKELFIYENFDDLNFKISLGVGGMFDILAQKTKLAPDIIRKLNIEWLYRFLQEPNRLFVRYKDMLLYFTWFYFKNFKVK